MDAVKFVKEYLRMCTKIDECEDCPVYKTDFCTVPAKERSQESAEEIVELVEEWAAAHTQVYGVKSVHLEDRYLCYTISDTVRWCMDDISRFYCEEG